MTLILSKDKIELSTHQERILKTDISQDDRELFTPDRIDEKCLFIDENNDLHSSVLLYCDLYGNPDKSDKTGIASDGFVEYYTITQNGVSDYELFPYPKWWACVQFPDISKRIIQIAGNELQTYIPDRQETKPYPISFWRNSISSEVCFAYFENGWHASQKTTNVWLHPSSKIADVTIRKDRIYFIESEWEPIID